MRVQSQAYFTVLTFVVSGCVSNRGVIAWKPAASTTKSAPRDWAENGDFTQLVPPENRRSLGPLHISRIRSTMLAPSTLGSRTAVAPIFDRLDDDHLRGAHHAPGLDRADADRAGAEDHDVAAGLELHEARAG